MTLAKILRSQYHTILAGFFCVAVLPSTMLMASSGEVDDVPFIPSIAVGHEAEYLQFMNAVLEYRPHPKSDEGMVVFSIADLLRPLARTANPLGATFDLSSCGDSGKYSSIHLGYKKDIIPVNKDKAEVWICPRFLVEQELGTFRVGGGLFSRGKHPFADIMDKWSSPVGLFWTWGNWKTADDNFDYLVGPDAMNNSMHIYEKWIASRRGQRQEHEREEEYNGSVSKHATFANFSFIIP